MNPRIERARYLGEQLAATMDTLAASTTGADALSFLRLLSRLEGYTPAERAAVPGLEALVSDALQARAEHAAELGEAAGWAIDLDGLLHDGRHLPVDDPTARRDGWLDDVLVVATVVPWLPARRKLLARGALAKAHAYIEGDAEAFLAASVLAEDRRTHESADALGPEARALLALLDELPLLCAFDAAARIEAGPADGARVDAVLARAERHAVEAAEDALADAEARAVVGLPSAVERGALAAADARDAVLVAMETGTWVLCVHRGVARLRFEGAPDVGDAAAAEAGGAADVGVDVLDGAEADVGVDDGAAADVGVDVLDGAAADVEVDVLDGAAAGPLAREADGGFTLPTAERLSLRLRVGPDTRVVRLPAEG